jgi:U3 small nucleolar RNA-associated protein 14
MDVDERRALSLQIAKGEELRRKAMGSGRGGDNNRGDEEDEGTDDETEEDLLNRARDILMETRNDDIEDDHDKDGKKTKKGKGLFQLEFMKRGMESQRARAKEEARKLLEELEANELAGMSSDDSSELDDYDVTERKSTIAVKTNKKTKVATEAETNKILPEGKIVASSLVFGKGDNFAVKVNGSTELDGEGNDNNDGKVEKEIGKAKKSRRKKDGGAAADNLSTSTNDKFEPVSVTVEEEENPWIVSKSTKKSTKSLPRKVNINDAASMLVDSVRDNKSDKRKRNDDDVVDDDQQHNKVMENSTTKIALPSVHENTTVGIAELSQAELVRRAFATPANLYAEEEFNKEKERMRERDDPTRQKKEETTVVSGWGSWAGAGAPPPRKQQRKLPPKLSAPLSKALLATQQPKRKDDGISTVIINEKRLKKTAKFQLAEIPYPYRSREEYERAISGNIGQEWNTIHGTKEMSRPAILVRAGKIIQPLATKAKKKAVRAPAKF